ncbi:MAG: class I SAM-dependent methyltransferase [Candidatus Methanomethylophilaceae archaeon]|nr:class I SAM-dependent methyltransferase [Candidatus Methanomethylophilaceae archaeon]
MVCQCSRPHGEDGRKTLEEMNDGHREQIRWGLDNLPEISPRRILDIGCGGGVFSRMAAEAYPGSECDGIDISELAIEFASESNKDLVDQGRMRFQVGDVSDLPFPDGTFDLAVTNASHFFWPDLGKGLSEICRVLRSGGVLCMTAGVHFSDEVDEAMREEFEMVNLLTDLQLMERIGAAGMDTRCVPGPDDRTCAYYGIKRRRYIIRLPQGARPDRPRLSMPFHAAGQQALPFLDDDASRPRHAAPPDAEPAVVGVGDVVPGRGYADVAPPAIVGLHGCRELRDGVHLGPYALADGLQVFVAEIFSGRIPVVAYAYEDDGLVVSVQDGRHGPQPLVHLIHAVHELRGLVLRPKAHATSVPGLKKGRLRRFFSPGYMA